MRSTFRTALVCVSAVTALAGYRVWGWPRPPIGTYVAALGIAAVLITLWPPVKMREKVAWLVFAFTMAYLEVSNLYRDRDEHDIAQRKYDAAQKTIRDGEFNNFKALMGRFDEEARLLNDEHDAISRLAILRERQVTIRQSPTGNLKERAEVLSRDILKYLLGHTGGGGTLFGGGTFGSSTFGGGENVVVGYSQTFRHRVIQIRNEFADFHLKDSELDTLMANPKSVPNIRKIAERITALAEKLK